MKKIFFSISILLTYTLNAQQFINSGKIEYEVRINNHKVIGDAPWADAVKDKMPQFSTYWYDLTFNDNKAIYKFDRLDEKTKTNIKLPGSSPEESIWFSDYDQNKFVDQKSFFGDTYLLSDSLMNLNWKLVPNETREIAGFICRKAQTIIFDSVYVFAFYTDEITVPGGPMGIHGLPGMILGVTVPRMFTSWIATSIKINGVDFNAIEEPKKGKKRKATDLEVDVKKATSDWGSWGQQAIWSLFL